MRSEPTKAEKQAAKALANAFRSEGHAVVFPPRDLEDKPDILVDVANVRVACECTQIPPSYIFGDLNKRRSDGDWEGADLLSVYWPNEPHQWIAEAIAKKTPLVPEYLARTGAREAWLLVHPPLGDDQFLVPSEQEWVAWALSHGSKMHRHPFTQIHLWIPRHGVRPVYEWGKDHGTHSELGIDFSDGYPTLCATQASLQFKTPNRSEEEPIRFAYRHSTRSSRIVAPRDPEYRRHQPAVRNAEYEFEVFAWPTRAEVSVAVTFADERETVVLAPSAIGALTPGQEYWYHYVHLLHAPRKLHTSHLIQPM